MQLLIACHCLWFEYYHCLLESNHLLTLGIAPATTSSRLAIMIFLPILMLTLTRDPRGTLGDEGNKKKLQTNTFCSNLLQDVIEVPASFQRHSAPPQTNNLHYQDTTGWGSHSLKWQKAQQCNGKKQRFTAQADELAALHPRRFAKAMYENLATR